MVKYGASRAALVLTCAGMAALAAALVYFATEDPPNLVAVAVFLAGLGFGAVTLTRGVRARRRQRSRYLDWEDDGPNRVP